MGLFSGIRKFFGLGGGSSGVDPGVRREGELSLARAETRSWEDRLRRMEEARDKALGLYRLADVFGGGAGTGTPAYAMPRGSRRGGLLGSIRTFLTDPYESPDWSTVPSGDDAITAWARERYSPFLDRWTAQKDAYDAARGRLSDTGRPEYYGAIGDAHRASATRDLDEQHGEAERRLRFALARRGLLGSSSAVDAFGRLGKRRADTLIDIGAAARGAERSAAHGD